ncbi:MAG: pyruvate kinase [Promethearchaeota archaeon]
MKQVAVPRIMCTLGKSTDEPGVLEAMKAYGMEAARVNTVHGTIPQLGARVEAVKSLGGVEVFLDLKGPQLRLHCDENYGIAPGDEFPLFFREHHIWLNHFKQVSPHIDEGMDVFLQNGEVHARVTRVKDDYAVLRVVHSVLHYIHDNMGVNILGMGEALNSLPILTERDKEAVDVGVRGGVTGFALSFVRSFDQVYNTVEYIRDEAERRGGGQEFTYLLKIEDLTGRDNLGNILRQCRSRKIATRVIVARGDLFVEVPRVDLPFVQREIVETCHQHNTPVVVGTGIFKSMQERPFASRAEYADLFQIVRQGADWVLLSDEVSNSKYPREVVLAVRNALLKYAA